MSSLRSVTQLAIALPAVSCTGSAEPTGFHNVLIMRVDDITRGAGPVPVSPDRLKEAAMPMFRLSPVDLLDPNWEASSHRGPAIVRARDEGAARAIAEKAFAVKTSFPPGHGIRVSPWTRPHLVKVERVDDPRWRGDDSDGILAPSFDLDLSAKPRRE